MTEPMKEWAEQVLAEREAWIAQVKQETGKSNMRDLLAMSEWRDPFNVGTVQQVEKARWFEEEVWKKYFDGLTGVHIRRIHYFILGKVKKLNGQSYQNVASDWVELQECCRCARMLQRVPADAFEDRRNPEAHDLHWEVAVERKPDVIIDAPDWMLPQFTSSLSFSWEIPKPHISGYDPDDYLDRAFYLELWVEKSTQNDLLEPLCQELGIRLVTASGNQSITNEVKLLQRVQEIRKPTRIFYVSDYDKAGSHMPVAVARQIEYWRKVYAPESDIKLTRLALTEAQIEEWSLPRAIESSDAVELDALEANQPGELSRIVRHAVDPYLDDSLSQQLREAAREARNQVDDEWTMWMEEQEESLGKLRAKVHAVVRRYEKEAKRLNQRLERELRPFRKPLAELQKEVTEASEEFDAVLPDRPTQEAAVVEHESAWLFDSSRSYQEQLAFYPAHSPRKRNGKAGHELQAGRKAVKSKQEENDGRET